MGIHGSKPKMCRKFSDFGDEFVFVEEGNVKIRRRAGGWGVANIVLVGMYISALEEKKKALHNP